MSTVPLPADPNLDQLRKQARDLQRAVRAGDPDAVSHAAEHVPDREDADPFTLQLAQLAIARHHGFASWARLKHHVEIVDQLNRHPDEAPPATDVVDEFLRLACLTYGDDGPGRWAAARRVLAQHPDIAGATIHAAAATASVADVERLLQAEPAAARRQGGPHRWEPLFYLAYARHDHDVARDDVLATAHLLLEAGADPDAGYLWHGYPTPFTVLTGVFGAGEQGVANQPPHPHASALARALLVAGADPNDRQALYNRQFEDADDHLVLLFEFGLGTETRDPWRARLGEAVQSPRQLVRDQLHWAVTHHQRARVALLADHGVDIVEPFADGRTPVELALLAADRAMADDLLARGARPAALDPVDALVAATLTVDRPAIDALLAADPALLGEAQRRRPSLVLRAAVDGGPDAVRLAVDLGFDVNAKGRQDAPIEQEWETALHHAAWEGNRPLAELLLALGADPTVEDHRFDGTPLGWARHGGRTAVIDLLEPLTPGPDATAPPAGDR
jgi:ankyrin repeat protein